MQMKQRRTGVLINVSTDIDKAFMDKTRVYPNINVG